MNDEELLRYSRHILLPQVDVEGQQRLLNSHGLIIGLGGLGSAAAMYLGAAGVGTLTLVDFDEVDLTNLQRQIAHGLDDVGSNKAASAARSIQSNNPNVCVHTIKQKLTFTELKKRADAADIVVDCCDNLATRLEVNRACVETRTPLVSGAAIRMEGQLMVVDIKQADTPCYECLYTMRGEQNLSCSEAGVLSPLVGVVGSMQALETLKLLVGVDSSATGKLMLFDAMRSQWHSFNVLKNLSCSVCESS